MRRPPARPADRANILIGAAIAIVIAAVVHAAILLTSPVGSSAVPEVALVWTMRWGAVTAAFTALSAFAIAATAVYAHFALQSNAATERTKAARELIKEYHVRGVEDALERSTTANAPDYPFPKFRRDLRVVVTYFEDCAIQYESQSVDGELLLKALDVTIIRAWRGLNAVALPKLRTGVVVGPHPFARLRELAVTAQDHLRARKDITPPEGSLEALPP